jgi:hypothetical protein
MPAEVSAADPKAPTIANPMRVLLRAAWLVLSSRNDALPNPASPYVCSRTKRLLRTTTWFGMPVNERAAVASCKRGPPCSRGRPPAILRRITLFLPIGGSGRCPEFANTASQAHSRVPTSICARSTPQLRGIARRHAETAALPCECSLHRNATCCDHSNTQTHTLERTWPRRSDAAQLRPAPFTRRR